MLSEICRSKYERLLRAYAPRTDMPITRYATLIVINEIIIFRLQIFYIRRYIWYRTLTIILVRRS